MLTAKGAEVERAARKRQVPWATALGEGLAPQHLEETVNLLQTVLARLEKQANTPKEEL